MLDLCRQFPGLRRAKRCAGCIRLKPCLLEKRTAKLFRKQPEQGLCHCLMPGKNAFRPLHQKGAHLAFFNIRKKIQCKVHRLSTPDALRRQMTHLKNADAGNAIIRKLQLARFTAHFHIIYVNLCRNFCTNSCNLPEKCKSGLQRHKGRNKILCVMSETFYI